MGAEINKGTTIHEDQFNKISIPHLSDSFLSFLSNSPQLPSTTTSPHAIQHHHQGLCGVKGNSGMIKYNTYHPLDRHSLRLFTWLRVDYWVSFLPSLIGRRKDLSAV